MKITNVVNALILINESLLMASKDKDLILPGGKLEYIAQESRWEDDREGLIRELSEEIPGANFDVTRFYKEFQSVHPFEKNRWMIYRTYFAQHINGLLIPSAEVDSLVYVKSKKDFEGYFVSDSTKNIISSLKKDGYLDGKI